MFKSIRMRMLLAHVSVSACILIASAAGVYLYMSRHLEGQLSKDLGSSVRVIERSLSHEVLEKTLRSDGEAEFRELLTSQHHLSFPEDAISVFDGARLVAATPGDAGFAINTAPHPQALTGTLDYKKATVGGRPALAASTSVLVGPTTYTIVVAEPESNLDLTLTSLRRAVLLFVLAALLSSIAGGYVLARRALKPVVDMARSVDAIDPRHLTPVNLPNPNDELGELGATFNRLLTRLHQAFEKERQFVADASHELRTPVSVSLLATQMALQKPRSGEEYRSSLLTIGTQLERLAKLIKDLLTVARADADGFVVKKQRCEIDGLVLEAVSGMSVLARQKKIYFDVDDWPEVRADVDPALFEQLVVILLDNAIKYSPPESRIRIDLRTVRDRFELDVIDQGPGIPKEARQRIFERFVRLDESRSRSSGEGAGLGLSIARTLAQAHNGTVALVQSGPGGSTFRISMPAMTTPAPVAERATV